MSEGSDILKTIRRELVVPKTQWNDFGKYYYRSTEDILLALKPLIEKYDVNIFFSEKLVGIGEYVYVEVTAYFEAEGKIFNCSASARDGITQGGMLAPMVTVSASSIAKKQALQHMFLIDDSSQPVPTKEEIEERERQESEKVAKEKEALDEKISTFVDECKKNIGKAGTMPELKGIFGMCYRNAKSFGQPVMDLVEDVYKGRKAEINAEKEEE